MGQVAEFQNHKVCHGFFDAGSLERGLTQRPLDGGFTPRKNRLSEEFTEVVVNFFRVWVFLAMHAHENVVDIDNHPEEFVYFVVALLEKVADVFFERVRTGATWVRESGDGADGGIGFWGFDDRLVDSPSDALAAIFLAGTVVGEFDEFFGLRPGENLLFSLLNSALVALPTCLLSNSRGI